MVGLLMYTCVFFVKNSVKCTTIYIFIVVYMIFLSKREKWGCKNHIVRD